ncbi:MAG: hypothetical protein HYT72_01960 [Candidatus Aenigmarchaeota archaeon]|nr:hypothetical protein [Candidatus Aenigmarchaeota archaeon]
MPLLPFADTSFIAAFLFIFAIVYALLDKAKVIEIKGANVAIAAVMGFFAASFAPLTQVLQSILPAAAIILVIVFFLYLGKKLVGGEQDTLPTLAVLSISLILLAVLWSRIAPMVPLPIDPNNMLWIIGVVIAVLIFAVAYRQK